MPSLPLRMSEREDDRQRGVRIDLNRIISDPRYRREILRRFDHARGPTRYRPGQPKAARRAAAKRTDEQSGGGNPGGSDKA